MLHSHSCHGFAACWRWRPHWDGNWLPRTQDVGSWRIRQRLWHWVWPPTHSCTDPWLLSRHLFLLDTSILGWQPKALELFWGPVKNNSGHHLRPSHRPCWGKSRTRFSKNALPALRSRRNLLTRSRRQRQRKVRNIRNLAPTLRTEMSWPEFHFILCAWVRVKILMAGWPKFWNTADAARLKKRVGHFDWLAILLTYFWRGLNCPTVGQARFSDEVEKNLGWKCSTLSAAKHRLLAPKKQFETLSWYTVFMSGCQILWQIRWNLKEFMPVQKLRRIQGLSLYGLPSAEWLFILKQWFEQPHLCQHKGQRAKLRFGPWFHYLWLPSQKAAAT